MLTIGSHGPNVAKLQRELKKDGFNAGAVDGAFGHKTETAVERFQHAAHIKADGVVGPKTWKALDHFEHAQHAKPQPKPSQPKPSQPKPSQPKPSQPKPASGKVPYGEPWKKGPGRLYGTDTSSYQTHAQFESAIRGAKWASVKATEGTGWTDPTFRSRWNELGKRVHEGKMKLRMAYHFMRPGNGTAQAKHFLNVLGIHGKLPAGTRLALDWEASALHDPHALRDAANYIHHVTGLWPLVYTSQSQLGRAHAAVPQAKFWEAKWTNGASVHNQPFVQYGGKGGIDRDFFNGNLKALERFAGEIA
jgi:GH25 family lysozyme M1 (1,4-beta-N-acetylmuramidase)